MERMKKILSLFTAVLLAATLAPSGTALETDTERPLDIDFDVGECEMFCDDANVNLVKLNENQAIKVPGAEIWVIWCQIGTVAFAQVNPVANQCLVGNERCDLSQLCGIYGVEEQEVKYGHEPDTYTINMKAAKICPAHVTVSVLGNTIVERQYTLVNCAVNSIHWSTPGIQKPAPDLPPRELEEVEPPEFGTF